MDFLRRHAFFMVCAAAGAVGIALMVTGARAMPKVLEEMKKAETIYRNVNSLQTRPVNRTDIDAAKRRIDLVERDRDAVLAKAEGLYGYEQLVPDALPDGDSDKRREFRVKYRAGMDELLTLLNYGAPATSTDLSDWQERIEEERTARKEYGLDPGAPLPVSAAAGPPLSPAGVLTAFGAQENPAARAHMAAAQRIYCYANHFDQLRPLQKSPGMDFWPEMKDTRTVDAPDPWDVWHAQLGYWIHKDVIEAIAALNNQAAETARKQDEAPWVGIMPVKELISIRISDGFIPRGGDQVFGPQPGGFEAALPPGTPETVFTHSTSTGLFDVIQFSVKLIMDQRDILRLVDRMCKDSFHTLLRVSYVAVPPNRKAVGKIYGSEPTVNVLLDFETILLGELFRPLFPPSVCEFYEITCP